MQIFCYAVLQVHACGMALRSSAANQGSRLWTLLQQIVAKKLVCYSLQSESWLRSSRMNSRNYQTKLLWYGGHSMLWLLELPEAPPHRMCCLSALISCCYLRNETGTSCSPHCWHVCGDLPELRRVYTQIWAAETTIFSNVKVLRFIRFFILFYSITVH